jgi:hypothetical protein
MEILRRGQRRIHEEYVLHSTWRDDPEAGFSFPCDALHVVEEFHRNPLAVYQG